MSFKTRQLSTETATRTSSDEPFFNLVQFHQLNPERYPYLLRSSAVRENNTQFDILLACPQSLLTLNADNSITGSGSSLDDTEDTFFQLLEKDYQQEKTPESADQTLPFTGGWFVYLSYEMAQHIEPCLNLPKLSENQPLAIAARCPAAVIYDKDRNELLAVAEDKYAHLLDDIEQDFLKLVKHTDANTVQDTRKEFSIELESINESAAEPYLKQVEKIKQYIVDGDIFQANLSRQWIATLKHNVSDTDLFLQLAKYNPSSFAAMACLENITIISSSPERLVSIKNNVVETRPIAGTRPRDKDRENDRALAEELLAHPKEQAEHIMLIDLERNDLGRVCRPGSIHVNELMALESWEHVHHIVSNVRGELQDNKSPIDVLQAVFPGGTITGCPKVRCMEILAELENEARGAYTGSLGYINTDGSMDFNILIRTMVRETDNNRISFRAGGGIVSDSIAEDELEETRAKAKGLLKIFKQ